MEGHHADAWGLSRVPATCTLLGACMSRTAGADHLTPRVTQWPTCSTGRSLSGVSSKPWGVSTWLMAPLSVFHTTRRPSDPEVTSIVVVCTGATGTSQGWIAVHRSVLRHQGHIPRAVPPRGHASRSRSTTKPCMSGPHRQAPPSEAGASRTSSCCLTHLRSTALLGAGVASAGGLRRWRVPMLWCPHSSPMAVLQGSPA